MALQGSLRDFGIADIFQLIAQQQKTGVLQLRRPDKGLDVYFTSGLICSALPPGEDPHIRLGQHLVRSGVLEPGVLKQASDKATQNLTKLRDFLVGSRLVGNDVVASIEKLYTFEAIYDLFVWQEGEFAFVQKDVQRNPNSFDPVSAEHVLMDGFRMVDEWPAIKRIVPDPGARIQKLSTPQPVAKPAKKKGGGDPFDMSDLMDDDDDDEESTGLSETEQKILQLADTGRNVQWVIDRSRMGAFEATKAVADLVTKGYLKLDIVSAQLESVADFFEPQKPARSVNVVFGATVGVALLILGAGFKPVFRGVTAPFRLLSSLHEVKQDYSIEQVRNALEVFRLLNGRYPDTLAEIERAGITPPSLGLASPTSPYIYEPASPGEKPAYSLEFKPAR